MIRRTWLLGVLMLLALSGGWIWYLGSSNSLHTTPDDPGEIVIEQPAKGATVAKRFAISGEANSRWFYEGVMPVTVTDNHGSTIWQGLATTTADWTQVGMIPFRAKIDLGHYAGLATISISRDNPSGEASYDKKVSIPVTVSTNTDAAHYAYDPGDMFIYSVASGGAIMPTFSLQGTARNSWFSGGTKLPAELQVNGKDIWKGEAVTSADTRTFGNVDFTISGNAGTYRGEALLIVHAANPDGDPAYDASYSLPVVIEE